MRRFKRLSIPPRAHPLVRRLYAEMNEQQIGPVDLAERAGIAASTIKDWRHRQMPRVDMLDACFTVLGMHLRPIPGARKPGA